MQLFDEVEHLCGDGKRFDTLVSVLNVGFERGGVVTRLERRAERYVEAPYEVDAPRVLAGIEGLKETLEDRALSRFMLRQRRAEPVLPPRPGSACRPARAVRRGRRAGRRRTTRMKAYEGATKH